MDYINDIYNYIPNNEQEKIDRDFFLRFALENENCLTRDNDIAHFTSSGWILNKDKTKVLLVWHKIYQSWSWTGGHADGNPLLSQVAVKEAKEETGLNEVVLASEMPISLETISVNGHFKNGIYLHSHLHLNLTFLLLADETAPLTIKQDENSDVRWFPIKAALDICEEPWMVNTVYQKLLRY